MFYKQFLCDLVAVVLDMLGILDRNLDNILVDVVVVVAAAVDWKKLLFGNPYAGGYSGEY